MKERQILGLSIGLLILIIGSIIVMGMKAPLHAEIANPKPSSSVSLVPQALRNATLTSHPVFGAIKNHITEVQYDGHIYLVYQEGITHKANCTNPVHGKKGGAQ